MPPQDLSLNSLINDGWAPMTEFYDVAKHKKVWRYRRIVLEHAPRWYGSPHYKRGLIIAWDDTFDTWAVIHAVSKVALSCIISRALSLQDALIFAESILPLAKWTKLYYSLSFEEGSQLYGQVRLRAKLLGEAETITDLIVDYQA